MGQRLMTASVVERVRRYYDENTRLFLSLGQSTEGAIHRAVWGPGVDERQQAMAYVDERVMHWLAQAPSGADGVRHVVDLGAGVCASLCRIARRFPIRGTGITLSQAQVDFAVLRIEALGMSDSVRCLRGDFCALPEGLAPAETAFAIESFIHAASAEQFFRQCAALVRPGGYLIVCDDFLSDARWRSDPRAAPWLDRVAKGWLAMNLITPDEAQALAARAGFTHAATEDLTPYLELGRPRDLAVGALMRALGWLPPLNQYWLMLYGGHALQVCLKRGWIQHSFMVWKRD